MNPKAAMWQARQLELARAQALLLQRSQALRSRLGGEARGLERPLALADRARSRVQWLLARPHWLAALALLPLIPLAMRPRRLLGVSLRLWSVWRTWQSLRAFLPLRSALPHRGGPDQAPWNPPAR